MLEYYFSRSSIITFIIIVFWVIGNIFINIPPDFTQREGEVINKTLVAKKECDPSKNHYHYFYDISYINDKGKVINIKNEEFRDHGKCYNKLIESNEYYSINSFNITLFAILALYGFIGFITTILEEGFNDISEFFSGYDNRLKAREMRINHFKILCNFIGYDNQQDYEDTMKAIEMFKNSEDYKYCVRNHYSVNIPTWREMFKEIKKNYDYIVNERNNIKDDKYERKYGGFCD